MTPDDWKYVEKQVGNPYGCAKLLCDGFNVFLSVKPIKELQFGIAVYVNGVIKGEWGLKECEESRRFWQRKERFLLNPSEREHERKQAKFFKRRSLHDKKFTYWSCYWTNFKAMRRHFERNNKDIQLVMETN